MTAEAARPSPAMLRGRWNGNDVLERWAVREVHAFEGAILAVHILAGPEAVSSVASAVRNRVSGLPQMRSLRRLSRTCEIAGWTLQDLSELTVAMAEVRTAGGSLPGLGVRGARASAVRDLPDEGRFRGFDSLSDVVGRLEGRPNVGLVMLTGPRRRGVSVTSDRYGHVHLYAPHRDRRSRLRMWGDPSIGRSFAGPWRVMGRVAAQRHLGSVSRARTALPLQ